MIANDTIEDVEPPTGNDHASADSDTDAADADTSPCVGKAVIDIQDPVLNAFTSAAIGQMVAMIGEDTRTYLQVMEQIYSMAIGKALAMSASPDNATALRGARMLENIETSQTATINFAKATTEVASAFAQFPGKIQILQ
ncbi:hypothetical protein [Agrobacterium vitis]|uniref:hypothetical protein n=1 Tax=Agrobacterium vitis TaxID=373 RepID=UPI001574B439|nr:hypothetical protein [Agrobacterium vitis]NSZ19251.1 hypothetical protein [Agrobacterium vitis]QZO06124.1 hypothetical protein K4831_20960 [Agrobacterium vitis]UJL90447.1 hypothetical protein AVF2S5_20995 [Agrobacterium vitis]